jgi:hypothetical protein
MGGVNPVFDNMENDNGMTTGTNVRHPITLVRST